MTIFKRLKYLVLAAVGVVTFALVPGTAMAGNSSYCNGAYNCIYDGANWVTGLGARVGGTVLFNLSSGANDRMSSWENKASQTGAWYTAANGTGSCITMPRNSQNNYIGDLVNDLMSSWKVNGAC